MWHVYFNNYLWYERETKHEAQIQAGKLLSTLTKPGKRFELKIEGNVDKWVDDTGKTIIRVEEKI